MKLVLLLIIRSYWFVIPEQRRRKCIFHKSCSNFVYDQLKTNGLSDGIKALQFRMGNCNSNYDIFTDIKTGRYKMLLKSGIIIEDSEIAERLK